jgi:hypothetical protein
VRLHWLVASQHAVLGEEKPCYFVGLIPTSLAVNEVKSSRRYYGAVILCHLRYHAVLRVLY